MYNGTLWAQVRNTLGTWKEEDVTLKRKMMKYDVEADEWSSINVDFSVSWGRRDPGCVSIVDGSGRVRMRLFVCYSTIPYYVAWVVSVGDAILRLRW